MKTGLLETIPAVKWLGILLMASMTFTAEAQQKTVETQHGAYKMIWYLCIFYLVHFQNIIEVYRIIKYE